MASRKNGTGMSRREFLLRSSLLGTGLLTFGFPSTPSDIASGYSDIIYKNGEDSPNQLYIIGQEHMGLQTLPSGRLGWFNEKTRCIQAEAFRTGEFLMRARAVRLFLSEGHFADKDYYSESRERNNQSRLGLKFLKGLKDFGSIQDPALQSLVYESSDWDAVRMLGCDYGVDIQGAEDFVAFEQHGRFLHTSEGDILKDKGDYLCNLRSAKILENSPLVIERELKKGRVSNRKAAILIGYDHVPEMIRYADADSALIKGLPQYGLPELDIKLNLREKGYGCTVYRPKSMI